LRLLQESELEGSLRVVLNPDFRLVVEPHTDRRRYNLPTTDQVAMVIPDGADRNARDVSTTIPWREVVPTIVLRYSTVRADLYSGVMDALRSDRADQIGDPVILAASYVGGDRFIARCYQVCAILNFFCFLNSRNSTLDEFDFEILILESKFTKKITNMLVKSAMAIARALGNPLVFTTITANPSWSEISAELEHNQTPDSRPDLIAKVFKLKLDQMLHDLKERYVCGV
ncbi:hypothetical protein EPUL_005894, partial [Erysiphe pulchra]